MNNKIYASLAASDTDLAERIRSEHQGWFRTIETALDQVIQGLNDFSEFKGWPDGGSGERANVLGNTDVQEPSHGPEVGGARVLAASSWRYKDGYGKTCLLLRILRENPAALNVLFSKEGRFGRGKLTYQKMAERISKRTGSAWATDYGDVSKYAAHPGMKALESIVTWDAAGKPHLSIASSYSKGQVAACVSMAAGVTLNLMATVFKLLRGTGSNWESQALPAFKRLMLSVTNCENSPLTNHKRAPKVNGESGS